MMYQRFQRFDESRLQMLFCQRSDVKETCVFPYVRDGAFPIRKEIFEMFSTNGNDMLFAMKLEHGQN